ncbi:hypothetical protein RDV89_01910 [Nocardioides zeae]|uniref:Squalene cyclase C-terminal domain-containing protein n=1 Tax=Nocardioides imazamoxiresistens TaxID=3231893 RepID=A0ABU3PRI6_9ACTN|nr:hypothetical protein [Nocardioides zeae]MDT9591806.1 hypothetical protein [Nocardioides zeae]
MSVRLLPGRRAGALAVAAVAASATTLALLAPAAATAAPAAPAPAQVPGDAYDPAPVRNGADWLVGELDGDVFRTSFGPNVSGTVDAARSLAIVGADADASATVEALVPHAASYVGDNGFGTLVGAGSTAKLAHVVQLVGGDPRDYAGIDLVAQLESRVATEGPTAGRISDEFDPENEFGADFANTIGQAFAADVLTEAGSELAGPVTDFLLQQQCADGGFRLTFSAPDAEDQSCTEDPSGTDVTAYAVQGLASQLENGEVATAADDAVAYLKGSQAADGSWTDGVGGTANANSTGLAGQTLGLVGDIPGNPFVVADQPELAAIWLRKNQVDEVATCTTSLRYEKGAQAFDPAALSLGRTQGITDGTAYQWQLSSAQTLPALQWTPAAEDDAALSIDPYRVRAGTVAPVGITGLAPGQSACLVGAVATPVAVNAKINGTTTGRVQTPSLVAGSVRLGVTLVTSTQIATDKAYWLVSATRFELSHSGTAPRNGNHTATILGAAAFEPITVTLNGRVVLRTRADVNGRAVLTFPVGSTVGRQPFVIRGESADRYRTSTVNVTR